jgi:putative membrane protein
MKVGSILGLLLGLALAAWLLAETGPGHVLQLLAQAKAGLAAIIAFHLVQVACSALGWRAVVTRTGALPGPQVFALLRWIREGINNLLPLAQIGGEVVGARLLSRHGVSIADAAGSTVVDLSLEVLTQAAFTLFGAALLLTLPGGAALQRVAAEGFLVLIVLGAGLLAAQWAGLFRWLEHAALRFGWTLPTGLHPALMAIWRDPRRVLSGSAWHLACWLLGAVEVMLAAHFLGHDLGWRQSMVLESLGQAFKSAAFLIPGGVGAQEGGMLLLAPLCGLPASTGLALALMKRLREVALGVPAIAAWLLPGLGAAPGASLAGQRR